MYYSSGSFITPSLCFDSLEIKFFCSLFSILGNFLSLFLDIADLDLYFSNFAPNNYTYIDFLEFNTAPQL